MAILYNFPYHAYLHSHELIANCFFLSCSIHIGSSSSPQSPTAVATRPNNNRGKRNGFIPKCSILNSPFPRSHRQLPLAGDCSFARLQTQQVPAAAPSQYPVSGRAVPICRHRSGLGEDIFDQGGDSEIRRNDQKGLGNGSVRLREERGVENEAKGKKSVEEVQLVYSELSRAHRASGMVWARESTFTVALVPWGVAVAKVMRVVA